MGLRPLQVYNSFSCGDHLSTSDSDVYRRQNLTSKVDSSTESVHWCLLVLIVVFNLRTDYLRILCLIWYVDFPMIVADIFLYTWDALVWSRMFQPPWFDDVCAVTHYNTFIWHYLTDPLFAHYVVLTTRPSSYGQHQRDILCPIWAKVWPGYCGVGSSFHHFVLNNCAAKFSACILHSFLYKHILFGNRNTYNTSQVKSSKVKFICFTNFTMCL